MNPGRFFMPNMAMNPIMMRNAYGISRNVGIFDRMLQGIRSFNWSRLLNGANKTLNVMNQTIPLIKQAGPMVNNVKSMVKLARAFGSETTKNNKFDHSNKRANNDNVIKSIQKKEVIDNNYPNFFV